MLKKHKNGFFEIIKKNNLDVNLFTAKERTLEDNTHYFLITLKETPLFFGVEISNDSPLEYRCNYTLLTPNYTLSPAFPSTTSFTIIDGIYNEFNLWVDIVVKIFLNDKHEPDLWDQFQENRSTLTEKPRESDDKSPFTENEKAQIRLSINEFKLLVINNFKLSSDEILLLDDRLDYLKKSVDRLNRFDWKGLVYQTLISISIALSFDSEKSRVLIDLFKRIFSSVVHLLN